MHEAKQEKLRKCEKIKNALAISFRSNALTGITCLPDANDDANAN